MDPTTLDIKTARHTWMRHIGIYAYHTSFLSSFQNWSEPAIGSMEDLEQLKALYNGARIHVATSKTPIPPSVNIPEDLITIKNWKK